MVFCDWVAGIEAEEGLSSRKLSRMVRRWFVVTSLPVGPGP